MKNKLEFIPIVLTFLAVFSLLSCIGKYTNYRKSVIDSFKFNNVSRFVLDGEKVKLTGKWPGNHLFNIGDTVYWKFNGSRAYIEEIINDSKMREYKISLMENGVFFEQKVGIRIVMEKELIQLLSNKKL